MKKIIFFVEGQKLHGMLFYPEKIKQINPAILFVHGWKSSERSFVSIAEALTKLGFICMTVNMRGHNGSDGNINILTRKNFLDDTCAAYDYLTQVKEVNKKQISVIGASFGGYLATLVSKERNVKNIVLRVPANYPNVTFYEPQIQFSGDNNSDELQWRFKILGIQETFSLAALHLFKGNILIIESENDQLVPHVTIENYLRAVLDPSQLTYVVMKGADHSIHNEEQRNKYTEILTDWFQDKI
ncbi:MAG TPA: alpha/beta fold hydrolase [Candidatus Sulfotelmatobacter sp.]|jgi:esterase/lipase|nr:alpha/beta fold hydrolase [Candidatus Sulfotelmatobacter sp.]